MWCDKFCGRGEKEVMDRKVSHQGVDNTTEIWRKGPVYQFMNGLSESMFLSVQTQPSASSSASSSTSSIKDWTQTVLLTKMCQISCWNGGINWPSPSSVFPAWFKYFSASEFANWQLKLLDFAVGGRKLMIWAHFIGINFIYVLEIACTNWLTLIYLIVGVSLCSRLCGLCHASAAPVGLLERWGGYTLPLNVPHYSSAHKLIGVCYTHQQQTPRLITPAKWLKRLRESGGQRHK